MSDKDDLTKLEDISEFLHEDNSEIDRQLDRFNENKDDQNDKSDDAIDDVITNIDSAFDDETISSTEEDAPAFNAFEHEDTEDHGQSNDDEAPEFNAFESSSDEDDFNQFNTDDSQTDLSFSAQNESEENDDNESTDHSFNFNENDTESRFSFDSPSDNDEDEQEGGDSLFSSYDEENNELDHQTNEFSFSESDEDNNGDNNGENNEDISSDNEFFTKSEDADSIIESFDTDTEGEESKSEEDKTKEEKEVQETIQMYQDNSETISEIKQKETFEDVKEVANSFTATSIELGGQPPFSILIRNVKYQEDKEDIISILREYSLLNESNENDYRKGLEMGQLLISQISEYSAIFLAHKLRRFDLELEVGLSDELHPSKSYSRAESLGMVSKEQMNQSKEEFQVLRDKEIAPEDIIITTSQLVEGKQILKYLGVASESEILPESDILEQGLGETTTSAENELSAEDLKLIENKISLVERYNGVAERLKNQVIKKKGNAAIGVQFALTPLVNINKNEGQTNYKITCTASIVWLS